MSKFSPEWLSLREPIDHRSRNQDLQTQVINYLAKIKTVYPGTVRLTDLGSGTGSNLRALAPHLNAVQHWTLTDYDPELLQVARTTLLAWADSEIANNTLGSTVDPSTQIKPLFIIKENKKMIVEFR
jgi:predicted nicotinamide N-methyase